jgi:hypothetical protein
VIPKYLEKNVDITHYSNFKTQAFAEYFYELRSYQDCLKLKELKDYAETIGLKMLFVG